jgi:7,8-dihydropterin-6-yl-methyl-4-(beta-D-ribofuranosyl)aminobenzene 5'-phosphate synthase
LNLAVTFENRPFHPRCIPMWGFSCYLPQYRVLFDTGSNGAVLLKNMEVLGISPRDIEAIVLSHFHWDHTGGLLDLLQIHGEKRVFVHSAFSMTFAGEAQGLGAQVLVEDDPVEVLPGVMTTGALEGPVKEQGLLVKGDMGWTLLTGCAHPGIIPMAEVATDLAGESLYLVMGGFHLMGLSSREVARVVRRLLDLEVSLVAPCHCTGDEAIETFAGILGGRCMSVGVGMVLEI